ncbi:serine hydrolase domain-containing protein [Microbispora sp. NPDC046933]|uniref:serine hydrolase domain-containing protein n=1 Tax=Microbispora sp. NPDC046933 TaxID=3155618 RepID=UPI00340463A1
MIRRELSRAARAAALSCAVLTLGTAVPATAATTTTGTKPRVGDVQQAMETLAKTSGVVGAIGEVYVDGKRVGAGSAGSRLLGGKGGKIPSGARYRIGSQTKQMTATLLLQLVEEGKISLDDKLADVLPDVVTKNQVERAGEITVRHLLRHLSGIPDYMPVGLFDFTTRYSPADLLALSRKKSRTVEIGTYQYSNTNYILLGLIIEKLTGHSLATEFKRRLFTPLGMKDTYLPVAPPQGITGPHGHGYAADDTGRMRDVDRVNASFLLGAGGVVSTAHDMSAFQRAFRRGKLLPASLQKVITDPPEGLPPLPTGGMCGGSPEIAPAIAGSFPGFVSVTYTSADGRMQFAVSTTLAMSDGERNAMNDVTRQAAKTVLCPQA